MRTMIWWRLAGARLPNQSEQECPAICFQTNPPAKFGQPLACDRSRPCTTRPHNSFASRTCTLSSPLETWNGQRDTKFVNLVIFFVAIASGPIMISSSTKFVNFRHIHVQDACRVPDKTYVSFQIETASRTWPGSRHGVSSGVYTSKS